MSKITLSGYIIVPDADLQAVLDELPNHVNLTRAEPGCIVFNVVQEVTEKHRFTVYEEFRSQDAFEFHQQRVQSSRWGEITSNVERSYTVQGLD